MAPDLCFQLTKFSHAKAPISETAIPWIHLLSDEQFVTISHDRRLTMRIIEKTAVLEEVDIGPRVDAAEEAQRQAGLTGQHIPSERLPIFGISKDALIAIRYYLPGGLVCITSASDSDALADCVFKARRLQLRLANPKDCQRLISILQARGMVFQFQPSTPAGRPGTGRPDTALSVQSSTSDNNSPFFQKPAPPNPQSKPFSMSSVEVGSFSQNRPSRSQRPPNPTPNTMHYGNHSNRDAIHPSTFFTRDETVAPRAPELNRPSTAQMYRSHTSTLPPPRSENRDWNTSPSKHAAADTPTVPHQAASTAAPPITLHSPRAGSSLSRPFPDALSHIPETLEHEIPPRRELPFKTSSSRTVGRSSSRPSSSSLRLPPLPKPTLAEETSLPPIRPRSTASLSGKPRSRPTTASPLKRTFEVYDDATSGTGKAPTGTVSASETYRGEDTSAAMVPKPTLGPMDALLARERALAERSFNSKVARIDSLADAPYELVSPPPKRNAKYRSIANGTGDYTVAPRAGDTASDEIADDAALLAYARQSHGDRAAALEEFMVSKLENPSFTILCRDIENCWQRIALGL